MMKGQATVVKHTGSHYMLSVLPRWELFPAVLRGKIRLKGSNATNPVAVGDIVNFEAEDQVTLENPAVITSTLSRSPGLTNLMSFSIKVATLKLCR